MEQALCEATVDDVVGALTDSEGMWQRLHGSGRVLALDSREHWPQVSLRSNVAL